MPVPKCIHGAIIANSKLKIFPVAPEKPAVVEIAGSNELIEPIGSQWRPLPVHPDKHVSDAGVHVYTKRIRCLQFQ
jgi:hypothetical protein